MSHAGKFLVSIPDLTDSNFFRSVVLLFRHDNQGAMGLVLNRPTNFRIDQVVADLSLAELSHLTPGDQRLYLCWGGPVKGPMMALHSSLALAESSIIPKVQFSVAREKIQQLVAQSSHPFRLYNGYCGWGPGQLESEIDAGGWLLCAANSDEVFTENPAQLWHRLCERVGLQIMLDKSAGNDSTGGANPMLN